MSDDHVLDPSYWRAHDPTCDNLWVGWCHLFDAVRPSDLCGRRSI